jgi:putative inorganic carbon (hco3(-)) transporter
MAAGQDNTSKQRLLYWKHGIEMIQDHPILGVGYFNFQPYFAAHYPQDALSGNAQLPHNIFIQVGTDAGLVGLGVFVMLLYRNLRSAREIRLACSSGAGEPAFAGNVAQGLAVALWGFIIAGQFVTVTYYPFFWINLALTVALANIVARTRSGLPPPTA